MQTENHDHAHHDTGEALTQASWISIPPLTDDEFVPLRGAQWIGAEGIREAQPESFLAATTTFEIPAEIKPLIALPDFPEKLVNTLEKAAV